MRLYNTLTRATEELKPVNPPVVTLYTCGPTVYDYLQIGNWAAFVRWDLLARVLRDTDYDLKWVMNITDVGHLVSDADDGEDKLQKGAKREGKTAWEVADFYTQDFLRGLEALNISVSRSNLPKATDHIEEQIDLIRKLEQKGFTYSTDDGVYYDTSKLDDYGKLAGLKIEDLKAGARVEYNPQKRHISDFALWKFSPKDTQRDMEWDSPWGSGFPGWHLECSAMAMKYLGETIDIHAGGIDHIPVHHTNEIAQVEAVTGKPFASIWLHSNFLTVDGVKLSKSLGNSYTLADIVEKGFDPLALRLMILQSHYRTQANFTWEGLEAAQNRLNELRAWADLRHQPGIEKMPEELDQMWHDTLDEMRMELSNDLNTPRALASLANLVSWMWEHPIPNQDGQHSNGALAVIDNLFGLDLDGRPDINPEQKQLLQERAQARDNKDFSKSDEIRGRLAAQGLAVRDTPYGQIWSRI